MRNSATSPVPRRDAVRAPRSPRPRRRVTGSPAGSASTPRKPGHVVEDAAPPQRRDLRRVAGERAEVAELRARRAAVPAVVLPHRHVRVGVDVRARVLAAEHELAHVAEPRVVDRPPRLVARRADALRRAVGEDLERRVAGEQRHAGEALAREPEHAAAAHERRSRPARARGVGAAAVAAGVPWRDDPAVGAELRERALDHRRGERAGARLVGRHPVERVAQLRRRVVGVAALASSRARAGPSCRGTTERVGRLQHVGLGPAAVLVGAHERVDVAHERGSAPCSRSQSAHEVRAAVLVPAVVCGASPSRGRSPTSPSGSGNARSMSCVTAAIRSASDASGSSSATQSSVRSRWRACGCTSSTQSRAAVDAASRHAASRSSRAAIRTASAIFTYEPQRHRLPPSASAISASLGSGFSSQQRAHGEDEAGRAPAALERAAPRGTRAARGRCRRAPRRS